ncbi:MAG: histidine phosphatase family protein [Bellilinea sp.]
MTLLLLIRHGENDVMQRHLTGRAPGVSLNGKGRQQAELLADALIHAPLKAVYSSPLERAIETAEPLALSRHLSVQVRPNLIEVDYGGFQGRTYKQLGRLKLWKALLERPSQIRFPGGETMAEVQQRVVADLDTLAREWLTTDVDGKSEEHLIAIVAHADVIRLALAHYLNMALDDFLRLTVNPASLSIVQNDGNSRPKVICINQLPNFAWPAPQPPLKRKKGAND